MPPYRRCLDLLQTKHLTKEEWARLNSSLSSFGPLGESITCDLCQTVPLCPQGFILPGVPDAFRHPEQGPQHAVCPATAQKVCADCIYQWYSKPTPMNEVTGRALFHACPHSCGKGHAAPVPPKWTKRGERMVMATGSAQDVTERKDLNRSLALAQYQCPRQHVGPNGQVTQCQVMLNYETVFDHLMYGGGCEFGAVTRCPRGCSHTGFTIKKQWAQHCEGATATCVKRLIDCPWHGGECGERVPWDEMAQHLAEHQNEFAETLDAKLGTVCKAAVVSPDQVRQVLATVDELVAGVQPAGPSFTGYCFETDTYIFKKRGDAELSAKLVALLTRGLGATPALTGRQAADLKADVLAGARGDATTPGASATFWMLQEKQKHHQLSMRSHQEMRDGLLRFGRRVDALETQVGGLPDAGEIGELLQEQAADEAAAALPAEGYCATAPNGGKGGTKSFPRMPCVVPGCDTGKYGRGGEQKSPAPGTLSSKYVHDQFLAHGVDGSTLRNRKNEREAMGIDATDYALWLAIKDRTQYAYDSPVGWNRGWRKRQRGVAEE